MQNVNTVKERFVSVSGYGWSGSSAVVDLLREFEGFVDLGLEFRLLKDPYGICDLHSAIAQNKNVLNQHIAVKNFQTFCRVLDRPNSKFFRAGYDYSSVLGIDFLAETQEFIQKLSSFSYQNNSMVCNYYDSRFRSLLKKLKAKFFNKFDLIHHFDLSESEFADCVSNYMLLILRELGRERQCIILDQAIDPNQSRLCQQYFDDLKTIVVDRDPRNIYVDLVNNRSLIGAELAIKDDVDRFVAWHQKSRNNSIANDSSILVLRFDDLVNDYHLTVDKIISFLGIENTKWSLKRFFDPDKSRKNVHQWKNYPNQSIMSEIRQRLPSYCLDS